MYRKATGKVKDECFTRDLNADPKDVIEIMIKMDLTLSNIQGQERVA